MRLTLVWLVLALSVPATALPASAQSGNTQSGSTQPQDSTQLNRFRLADSYMRAGQFERAITLLEDLYAEAPGNPSFYGKLKEAYEGVKRYDDAIALVDERMSDPPSPMRASEKARLLYLKGDEEAAYATWDEALTLAPNRSSTYRTVYQALVNIRRFDRAIDVLLQGRSALDAPDAFRLELAYLYSLNGDHRRAMEEYVAMLAKNPDRVGFVRSRLSAFVEQDEGLSASIEVLETAVRDRPLNRGYRELLAWLHMEDEDYRAAFDVFRAIDRLERENGRVLFRFAQQAADADAYAVASDAFDLILSRYPDAPVAPDARRGLGDMHRRWASHLDADAAGIQSDSAAVHYRQAADAYRTFLDAHPNHRAYPEVLRQLGTLQQDVFRTLDDAEATLREVVTRYPNAPAADQARYDLGRIALQRGDLADARLAFSRLVERVRTGDLAEQARYELALLHFYQGEFDAALTRVEATNENTATDVANDAIELKVLLRQNRGPDSLNVPLQLYADAQLYERQNRPDDAIARLDSVLSAYGQHPLADNARFHRAELLRRTGRVDDAIAAFGEIPLIHPRSPFADRSLFALGTLHEEQGQLEDAVAAYNRLLETFPASLLADDARARLRQLWSRSG